MCPPYAYRLRPLDRHADDDERHAEDDLTLTYTGLSQANLSTRYLSISVSTVLYKQLEISAGTSRGATNAATAAAILHQQVPSDHAGQPLPASTQIMLTGDEIHIPHDAHPDDGTGGDGNGNTDATTTERYVIMPNTADDANGRESEPAAVHAAVPAAISAAVPAAVPATVPATVPAAAPAMHQQLQRMDPECVEYDATADQRRNRPTIARERRKRRRTPADAI